MSRCGEFWCDTSVRFRGIDVSSAQKWDAGGREADRGFCFDCLLLRFIAHRRTYRIKVFVSGLNQEVMGCSRSKDV